MWKVIFSMIISTIILSTMFGTLPPIVDAEERSEFKEAVGYKNGFPVFLTLAKIPNADFTDSQSYYLQKPAAEQWVRLTSSAFQDGLGIKINYAFRTSAQQRAILHSSDSRFAAKLGQSPHQLGIAVDVNNCVKTVITSQGKRVSVKTPLFYWLKRNAIKFGFSNTMKNEPWHWEYVLNINNENS